MRKTILLTLLCFMVLLPQALAQAQDPAERAFLKAAAKWEKRTLSLQEVMRKHGWYSKSRPGVILPLGYRWLENKKQFHPQTMLMRYHGDWSSSESGGSLEALIQKQCTVAEPVERKVFIDKKNELARCWLYSQPNKDSAEQVEVHTFYQFRSYLPGSGHFIAEVVQIKLDHLKLKKGANPTGRAIASTLGVEK